MRHGKGANWGPIGRNLQPDITLNEAICRQPPGRDVAREDHRWLGRMLQEKVHATPSDPGTDVAGLAEVTVVENTGDTFGCCLTG